MKYRKRPVVIDAIQWNDNPVERQADSEGMTLRDYFAGQALLAIVTQHKLNSCGDFVANDGLLQHHKAAEYASDSAYRFADAMLEARVK